MTPEQRALFQKMQALMCIIEGYSNHVMNAVGRDLLPNYERIARRFEATTTPANRCRATLCSPHRTESSRWSSIASARSSSTRSRRNVDKTVAQRVWDGPEYLPTMEEIRNPSLWLQRFDAMTADQLASAGSVASR